VAGKTLNDAIAFNNITAIATRCEHGKGVIRRHSWCITVNSAVYCTHEIVLNPDKLTTADGTILHPLGVT
jgi:hypothetical protein